MFDLLLQAAVDMAWQHFIEAFQTMLYTVLGQRFHGSKSYQAASASL